MAFDKITDADLVDKGVIGLPDVPNLNTAEMQEKFEEVCRDVIIPKFNALIDALVADTAAGTIGSKTGLGGAETNIQQCLDSAKSAVLALEDIAHSHDNKTQLDTITSTLLANIDSVILLLSGITDVVDTVTDSAALIPSCKAIVAYVSALGAGDMLKATYDANNDNVADVAMEELTNWNGTPSDGQVPVYDADDDEWKPQTPVTSIEGASDADFDSLTANDLVVYDGSDFTNVQPKDALSLSSDVPPKTSTVTKGLTDVLETIGSGASQAYSTGDIILCTDGYWYQASTDIAQNNTLVLNGNVTKTNQRALNTSLTALQNKNNYSSTEHVIGKWTDGTTDVYEKTLTGTSITSGAVIDSSITGNNSNIISIEGSWGADGYYFTIPYSVTSGGALYRIEPRITPNGVIVLNDGQTVNYYTITIRYTKKNS